MRGVLRCHCAQCQGAVTYPRVEDFLAAHQPGSMESVDLEIVDAPPASALTLFDWAAEDGW